MSALTRLSARAIEAIRVNTVTRATRQGRPVIEKRRRLLHTALFPPGNLFLRLSRSHIHMWTSPAAWIAHELDSFARLHGPERVCGPLPRGLYTEVLPGRGLRALLAESPGPEVARAVARELRRAHALRDDQGAPWSHGDLHLDNVLFDGERAWLIDFETRHRPDTPAVARHADDLLVLLLDAMGLSSGWATFAAPLLQTYADPAVLRALAARLTPPTGLEAVLWSVRTHHMDRARLRAALERLREVVDAGG